MCIFFRLISVWLIAFLISNSTAFALLPPHPSLLAIDAETGDVLVKQNYKELRYPASLTKLMTLYLVFEALEDGRLQPTQQLAVSRRAASMPASKLYLKPGSTISVKDAIYGLTIISANDAAVVLAEAVAGTEKDFAVRMTRKAGELGMVDTVFKNASGLFNFNQKTTAFDMAKLALAIRKHFVSYYPIFGEKEFYYGGRIYQSHNRVLNDYAGADGLKTGYIRQSGYNIITSATRDDKAVIAVVMGERTASNRNEKAKRTMDEAFAKVGVYGDNSQKILKVSSAEGF